MPEANPPMPLFPGAYTLAEISIDELNKSVKPKQFLHIDQSECIMCEGCVDICPWKCIHMLSAGTVEDSLNVVAPGTDPDDHVIFVVDEDVCTRCGLCVDRCPTGVIIMGKAGVAPKDGDQHMRDNKHGYSYGIASKRPRTDSTSERTAGNHVATPMQPTIADKAAETVDNVQGSQAWGSIFRPGSIFRKGYSDSPRNPPQHPATPGTLRLAARLDAKRQLRSGHGLHAPWLREAHRVPTRK